MGSGAAPWKPAEIGLPPRQLTQFGEKPDPHRQPIGRNTLPERFQQFRQNWRVPRKPKHRIVEHARRLFAEKIRALIVERPQQIDVRVDPCAETAALELVAEPVGEMADASGIVAEDLGLRNDVARVFNSDALRNARNGVVAVKRNAMSLPYDRTKAGAFDRPKAFADPERYAAIHPRREWGSKLAKSKSFVLSAGRGAVVPREPTCRDPIMSPASSDRTLSVVMPVHNALPHLDAAVRSILEQTHRDFEFVILDDASTDGSTERLKEWAASDDRIRLHLGKKNLGPAASSNFVVRAAEGAFVARMDADDISHPDRLRRQLEILRAHPEAGLVGSLCDVIDEQGRMVRGPDPWRLRHSGWFAPFPHGSIMYRRELFDRAGGYREQCVYWEDLDLFLRIAGLAKVLTVPEPLYQHRHSHSSTRLDAKQPERIERATDLMYRCVEALDSGSDYEDLLTERNDASKVDPRVFRARGSIVLWSGHRPRVLKRLLQRGKLRPDLKTVLALGWACMAALSPGALRLALKGLAWSRNSASRSDAAKDVVEWRLPRPVPAKEPESAAPRHNRKPQAS